MLRLLFFLVLATLVVAEPITMNPIFTEANSPAPQFTSFTRCLGTNNHVFVVRVPSPVTIP